MPERGGRSTFSGMMVKMLSSSMTTSGGDCFDSVAGF